MITNSVSQVALFLFPLLVLCSLPFAEALTFSVDPIYIVTLLLTAIAVWQITGDGEATLFGSLMEWSFLLVEQCRRVKIGT